MRSGASRNRLQPLTFDPRKRSPKPSFCARACCARQREGFGSAGGPAIIQSSSMSSNPASSCARSRRGGASRKYRCLVSRRGDRFCIGNHAVCSPRPDNVLRQGRVPIPRHRSAAGRRRERASQGGPVGFGRTPCVPAVAAASLWRNHIIASAFGAMRVNCLECAGASGLLFAQAKRRRTWVQPLREL